MINKILRSLIPPFFEKIYYRLPLYNFKFFWKDLDKKNLPKDLIEITNKFIRSDSYKEVSNYWHFLNIKHFKQLSDKKTGGIKNVGTTLSLNYFTILNIYNEYIETSFQNIANIKSNYNFTLFKKHKHFNYETSLIYNSLTILLYENLRKLKTFKFLKKLNDKSFIGFNDPYISIKGMKITHDKLNSLIDYNTICSIKNFKKKNIICEIGAGSGRLCDTILTLNKKFKYVISDITPSIYVSYTRLKKAFPNKKILLGFDIENNQKMMEALKKNDIIFIFPHQIKLFNKKTFKIFIAADCLHEMNKKTINKYMTLANSHSEYLYIKIWKKTNLPFSLMGNYLSANNKSDYSIKNNWKQITKKESIFPSNMYEFIYKL